MNLDRFNRRYPRFNEPTDYTFLREEIVSHLMDVGPRKTAEIEAFFKGKTGVTKVRSALKLLQEKGTIIRSGVTSPWRITK